MNSLFLNNKLCIIGIQINWHSEKIFGKSDVFLLQILFNRSLTKIGCCSMFSHFYSSVKIDNYFAALNCECNSHRLIVISPDFELLCGLTG